jgi:hypothetical protein
MRHKKPQNSGPDPISLPGRHGWPPLLGAILATILALDTLQDHSCLSYFGGEKDGNTECSY